MRRIACVFAALAALLPGCASVRRVTVDADVATVTPLVSRTALRVTVENR